MSLFERFNAWQVTLSWSQALVAVWTPIIVGVFIASLIRRKR